KRFNMVESRYASYKDRTKQNIIDADLTIIFGNLNSAGSNLTVKLCKELKKSYLENPDSQEIFLNCIMFNSKDEYIINVAGNRESTLHKSHKSYCMNNLNNFFYLIKGYNYKESTKESTKE